MSTEHARAKITVIGVGNIGCLTIKWLEDKKVEGLHLLYANTTESLKKQGVEGFEVTVESGSTEDPYSSPSLVNGNLALKPTPYLDLVEDQDAVKLILQDKFTSFAKSIFESNLLFIVADLSEPLANQIVPVIAAMDAVRNTTSVALVTSTPSKFIKNIDTDIAIKELCRCVDTVIQVPFLPNQLEKVDVVPLFREPNIHGTLAGSVQAITDLINEDGIICIDFTCVSEIFKKRGLAVVGYGVGSSVDRALVAAKQAVKSKLLNGLMISEAKGILISMASGYDVKLSEFDTVATTIRNLAGEDCLIVLGDNVDESMEGKFSVTIFLTGF
jgi:cell division protein FtsZ